MMNGRERMEAIFAGGADRSGFWHGNPHDDTTKIYYPHFGVEDDMALSVALGDDFVWIMADQGWSHPEGRPMFDVLGGRTRTSLNQDGVFAETTSVAEVEACDWPDPEGLDFSGVLAQVERARSHGFYVLSGMWSPFFHVVADFFGMENYFVKMYTDPAVVDAVTEHVVGFYLAANERYFAQVRDRMDAFFFGNDFGSQLDLLISPKLFRRFVLPHFARFTEQAKSHGYRVVLHSCGAIERTIPALIDAGIDGLHPLQALAKGMEAETLARKYGDDLVFIGGVDTQQLLPFGTPEQVRTEVRRLREVFGPRYVVSPSHEALLPNVSVENLLAMAEAAREV
jgi:uroporphyrinogen decarboxylase